jgi:molybdopterin-biosynthesis enzyme MoeA-like protein
VVITSGGLGPTADDLTRQAIANATDRRLVYSRELENQIAARFRRFGRTMTDNNKRQAFMPDGSIPLANPVGTAPCFLSEDRSGRGFIVCLPGVPRELEYLMNHTVIPLLVDRMGGAKVVRVRILRTCAVGESNVDLAIRDLMTESNPSVGLAAHPGQTDVRITAKADTQSAADDLIAPVEAAIRDRLGVAVYGVDKESVPEVVGRLLRESDTKLGVMDMLTGRRLVDELVDAGFGKFVASVSAPSNAARTEQEAAAEAARLAESAAPPGGIGLALYGAISDDSTVISVFGPEGLRHTVTSQSFRRETEYIRRWIVIQGLDWVRRALLGQMASPVDWKR